MPVLLDTGILLRIPNRNDLLHGAVRSAVHALTLRGEPVVTTLQNVSEFWNVCTRPTSARGGLGLAFEQAENRLRLLERFITILPEPPGLYAAWRQIVMTHRVSGVQVHDAKLVAAMALHGIDRILTLNATDFRRYAQITAVTP
jgi:predicted nucleic acid-binding protein